MNDAIEVRSCRVVCDNKRSGFSLSCHFQSGECQRSAVFTPILRELHWLPIKARIEYKIILLTYKSLKGLAPYYLRSLLSSYAPKRMLRSSAKNLLQTPIARTKAYGERSFSVAAQKLWNNLPDTIKNINSLDSFKKNLKTFLFRKHLS